MTATTQIMTEADTCRELVTPKLVEAGWGNAPHVIGEQRTFTNGRIIVTGGRVRRGKQTHSCGQPSATTPAIWAIDPPR